MAYKIAEKAAEYGGRCYYVGGFVRDTILGTVEENPDIDIEVHGIEPENLVSLLSEFGSVEKIGASFGIYGIKGYKLDIALPRKEKATGRGHRDFEVFCDPFIGCEKAALRRDFTVNALMKDVLTGEILDFYGGLEDMKNKSLRMVNSDSFSEDALRVLRGAQFAARFGFSIEKKTMEFCSKIDLSTLAGERVFEETKKALLKAEKPSVFFELLYEMNQLDYWFPEIKKLKGVLQNPVFHPEGDVWNHTMAVIDYAATLREKAEYPMGFMFAALCHDFGKITATRLVGERIRSVGHEREGLPIARAFLSRITSDNALKNYVLNMISLHMEPNKYVRDGSSDKAYMKVFDKSVCCNDLLLIAKSDSMGKGTFGDYSETEKVLREKLALFNELSKQPEVMGKDLIEAGLTPGKYFAEALDYSHKLHLAGVPKDEALKQTLTHIGKAEQSDRKNGQ